MSEQPSRKLIEIVDDGLRKEPYEDPSDFYGAGLLAVRTREREAMDIETRTGWLLVDRLSTSTNNDGDDLESRRIVSLCRGEGSEQVIFNLDADADILSVNGLGKAMFRGDPREEFLVGLRLLGIDS